MSNHDQSRHDHEQPDIYERRESSVRTYARNFPVSFERATGATLTDSDGRDYIDFLAGCSSLNYGHNHPALKGALLNYIAADGVTHGLDMQTSAKGEFLREFERTILAPRDMDHRLLFPGPTGANAVEAALKLARKVTGRQNVIAFTNGFHGVTLGALAATGNAHHRGGAGMPLTGVTRMPFDGYMGDGVNTADLLERMLDDPSSGVDAPAAIIVETVQGEGGLNVASGEWLRDVERIARAHDALFIIDDIQAGCGRTSGFFSFESAGVKPDIITLAKSLSGMGLPLAVTLVRPQYDCFSPGEHNGTFRGNNHAFVTATAALRAFWKDQRLEEEVAQKGEQVRGRLQAIARSMPGEARLKGRGMMRGIDVGSGERASAVTAAAFRRGLIIETSGPRDEVLKVLAPLTIDGGELERGLDILAEAIEAVLREERRAAA